MFGEPAVYEFVANDIEFQPYYGSLKGAVATLESRSGNATDQASLLIALLRAIEVQTHTADHHALYLRSLG